MTAPTHIELHICGPGDPDERRRFVPVAGTMFRLDSAVTTAVRMPRGDEFLVDESLDEIKEKLKSVV